MPLSAPQTDGVLRLNRYPGVITGALPDNNARAQNATAINAAIAYAVANGLGISGATETFELYGPVKLTNGIKCTFQGIKTKFVQHQDQVCVLHCGPPLGESTLSASDIVIDGGWFYHANNQAGLGTGGRVLELTNTWGSSFKNMILGNFYDSFASAKFCNYGIWLDGAGGVEPFNNLYEHIKIKWFDQYAVYLDSSGTGSSLDQIYIQNGNDSANRASSNGAVYIASGSGTHFGVVNVEWAKLKSALYLNNATSISIDHLHVEECSLRNSSGTANRGLVELTGGSHLSVQSLEYYNSYFVTTDSVDKCAFFQLGNSCYLDIDMLKLENNTVTGTTLYVVQSVDNSTGIQQPFININNIRSTGSTRPSAFDNITMDAAGNTYFKYQRVGMYKAPREELVSLANAAVTIYAGAYPQDLTMSPSTARILTLSNQTTNSTATTPPLGTIFWITCATGSAGSITVNNHDATTLKSLTAGTWAKVQWNGTNWVTRGAGTL